jgi:hypothetical protein
MFSRSHWREAANADIATPLVLAVQQGTTNLFTVHPRQRPFYFLPR